MRASGGSLTMALVTLVLVSFAAPASAGTWKISRSAIGHAPAALVDAETSAPFALHQGKTALPPVDTFNGFMTRTYTDAQGDTMTYYLYAPPGAEADGTVKYPVVLLLHGDGEWAKTSVSAAQNRAKILNAPYVKLWGSPVAQGLSPSFVIVPQAVESNRWVNVPGKNGSYAMTPQPTTALALAKDILDETEREESAVIDRSRVYITGISMGAYGVWDAIERWPSAFAAAAPMAGAGDPWRAWTLVNLPIWAFHGSDDKTVPLTGSRDMITAIQAAGGKAELTVIPKAGHDVWMRAYTSPDFMPWLFSQRASA